MDGCVLRVSCAPKKNFSFCRIGSKHQLQKLYNFQDHFTNRLAKHLVQNNIRYTTATSVIITYLSMIFLQLYNFLVLELFHFLGNY